MRHLILTVSVNSLAQITLGNCVRDIDRMPHGARDTTDEGYSKQNGKQNAQHNRPNGYRLDGGVTRNSRVVFTLGFVEFELEKFLNPGTDRNVQWPNFLHHQAA